MKPKTIVKPLEELSRSQIIIPFGVGAIFDYENFSAITMEVDAWNINPDMKKKLSIKNDRLLNYINKKLRLTYEKDNYKPINYLIEAPLNGGPYSSDDVKERSGAYAARKFPNWGLCVHCYALSQYKSDVLNKSICTNSKSPPWNDKLKSCKSKGGSEIQPVRFVCYCDKGHIQDFPWVRFLSTKCDDGCKMFQSNNHSQSNPSIYFKDDSRGKGFLSLRIHCGYCKKSIGLAGFNKAEKRVNMFDNFGSKIFGCEGEKPWSSSGTDVCNELLNFQPRSASKIYVPIQETGLYVPRLDDVSPPIIDEPSIAELIYDENFTIPEIATFLKAPNYKSIMNDYNISDEEVIKIIEEERENEDKPYEEVESDFLFSEYKTLCQERIDDEDFVLRKIPLDEYNLDFKNYFESLHAVKKVTTTTVLLGFQRNYDNLPNSFNSARKNADLLPAFKHLGEGIFINFGYKNINKWINNEEKFSLELKKLEKNFKQTSMNTEDDFSKIDLGYILIHTFSHILMRQLTIESGYGLSDIKERIYYNKEKEMAGLLIYTSGSDSSGSLGGLVRTIKPNFFEGILINSIENAKHCSCDPICYESEGQGWSDLNLAGCHACVMTSDLSCEPRKKNSFLDRKTLIGIEEGRRGYFIEI